MKKHKPASPHYKGEQWKRKKKKIREEQEKRAAESIVNQYIKYPDPLVERFGWNGWR